MRVISFIFDRVSHIAKAVSGFLDFDYIPMGSHSIIWTKMTFTWVFVPIWSNPVTLDPC